jgi:D-beta-D-heptose 7-phosphate kinase/D-beta-D-heptose 1-phosphate adenosyltransferase
MLESLREKMSAPPPKIWVIGDIMLDRYLLGTVGRVSPEAPVPVLLLSETSSRLGGAANVAQNIVALGGQVALGGLSGSDAAGDELQTLLAEAQVGCRGVVRSPSAVTTVKQRALASGQQLLRIDREQPRACVSDEVVRIVAGLAQDLSDPDVIVLSDYNKGVITTELIAQLRMRHPNVPIFVDPKVRDVSRYTGVQLIKPNEREAALASGVEIRDEASLRQALLRIQMQLPGTRILITRGAQGMALLGEDGQLVQAPAQARRVFDVTGAGDVAIATLAMARAWELDWPDALRVANAASGIAVGKIGAAPVYAAELASALSRDQFGLKLLRRSALPELRRTASALGQRIVFTNGCFDLLHIGHLRLLEEARAMGDLLVVAVNDDASVRRLKGKDRPINCEQDRAALLAGLEAVDFVTVFEEDTPLETVLALRPDVLVKGGDYTLEQIVGADEVLGWGGRVNIVPFVIGRSTTRIIEGISKRPLGLAK